jgi:hypothetical protein
MPAAKEDAVKRLSWLVATMIGLTAPATVAVGGAAGAPPGRTTCAHPSGRVVTLGVADDRRALCVHRGQRINVTLVVDPVEGTVPEQWWHPVELRGAGLTALPMTLMAVRGTTLARYRATAHGSATLSSLRHPCAPPPPGGVSCDTIQSWSVTVIVR